jgi:hypothetical protein
MSTAEERLAALGVLLEEIDFGREDEPDVGGCIMAEDAEGGTRVKVVIRPGLSGEPRATFAEWAESRFARLIEHGPDPDGWEDHGYGRWQLWARMHQLPRAD